MKSGSAASLPGLRTHRRGRRFTCVSRNHAGLFCCKNKRYFLLFIDSLHPPGSRPMGESSAEIS